MGETTRVPETKTQGEVDWGLETRGTEDRNVKLEGRGLQESNRRSLLRLLLLVLTHWHVPSRTHRPESLVLGTLHDTRDTPLSRARLRPSVLTRLTGPPVPPLQVNLWLYLRKRSTTTPVVLSPCQTSALLRTRRERPPQGSGLAHILGGSRVLVRTPGVGSSPGPVRVPRPSPRCRWPPVTPLRGSGEGVRRRP